MEQELSLIEEQGEPQRKRWKNIFTLKRTNKFTKLNLNDSFTMSQEEDAKPYKSIKNKNIYKINKFASFYTHAKS